MATETEKLYNESTAPVAETATETTPAATPYTTGNTTLDNYNTGRVDQINQMYDQQRDNAVRQLETAHNRTMADAQAAYDKITPKYQESRNAVGAEYERQRRNNNLQAAANGLNTGAGSQMQLASSAINQMNQAGLQKAENQALNEANRNMLTMKEQYDADVADALAKNDTQRAAALLNEYGQQYDRMQNEAKQLAAYGDFSLYATIYGQEAADAMQKAWDLQNPQLAYTLGRITADEYLQMTGKYPPGYGGGGGGSSSGGGRSYGYGGSSGGGADTYNAVITSDMIKEATQNGMSVSDIRQAAADANAYLPVRAFAEAYDKPAPQAKVSTVAAQLSGNKSTPQAKASTITSNYVNPLTGKVRSGVM